MHPILVVDDEQAIAMLIRRILTDAGYRCEAVTDSIKAADLLEKKQYDLVLLDIMMPQIDGYDLLNYIRPTGTPCIFITAKAAVEDRVRGLHSGADDYIVKPFAPAELVARVESVLRRAGRSMVVYDLWDLTVDTAACWRWLEQLLRRLRRWHHWPDQQRNQLCLDPRQRYRHRVGPHLVQGHCCCPLSGHLCREWHDSTDQSQRPRHFYAAAYPGGSPVPAPANHPRTSADPTTRLIFRRPKLDARRHAGRGTF